MKKKWKLISMFWIFGIIFNVCLVYTSCNRISDEVKVTLYLQQLKNGVWQTVHTLGPKTAYSTNYVSNSKNYTVAGGYYYRVSGSHTAIKGKVVETTSSESDGLWISK